MINLHNTRQTFDYDCGAKALQTVMAYYGVDVREDDLMRQLGSGKDGTRVDRMIAVAESHGFRVDAACGRSIAEINGFLDQAHPVIVLLQAWSTRYMTLQDWRKNHEDGHYAVLIAHARGVLLFEDPASFRRTWLREREFLARWHDRDTVHGRDYERFGMVLLGREPSLLTPQHMD